MLELSVQERQEHDDVPLSQFTDCCADGCTKGFQCKLTHIKRVPKVPTSLQAQTQEPAPEAACDTIEQRSCQREDSASGVQGFVPPHTRRPPPSGPAALKTNHKLPANTSADMNGPRPGIMSASRHYQAPSSSPGQPQPGTAGTFPATMNLPPHMRTAPPRTMVTLPPNGPSNAAAAVAAPAAHTVPPHMRVGTASNGATAPNSMRSHTPMSSTTGCSTGSVGERTNAEKLSLGAGIDSLASRVAAADAHVDGIPLTGTRPGATSPIAPVISGREAH